MTTLPAALAIFGITRDIFNGWERHGLLTTVFADGSHGVPRSLTKANAAEIGFMSAFAAVKIAPARAAVYSAALLRSWRHGAGKIREWLVIEPGDEPDHGVAGDQLDADLLQRTFGERLGFTVINVGEVLRRVDRLFSEKN